MIVHIVTLTFGYQPISTVTRFDSCYFEKPNALERVDELTEYFGEGGQGHVFADELGFDTCYIGILEMEVQDAEAISVGLSKPNASTIH